MQGPEPVPRSLDETVRKLGNIPLFMRELPADGELDEDSAIQLDGLKALLYEGDAEERAQNFKSQGNENFKGKRYREALAFYTQGLGDLSPELKEETKRILLCNRAACNLELGNYRACLRDCSAVLMPAQAPIPDQDQELRKSTTLKALFRSTRALLALDRLDDAQDTLERYLREGGPNDAGFAKLQQELDSKVKYRDTFKRERDERQRRQRETDEALASAVRALNLVLPKKWSPEQSRQSCPPDVIPPHFDPEHLPPALPLSRADEWKPPLASTPLIFPVFLLRPLAAPPTRDLILSFHQDVTFGDQLDAFAAQNPQQNRSPAEEVVYAVTKAGRILKVGRKVSLKRIIEMSVKPLDHTQDGLELVEGWCLEFYIVPKGEKEAEWIQEMKRRVADAQ